MSVSDNSGNLEDTTFYKSALEALNDSDMQNNSRTSNKTNDYSFNQNNTSSSTVKDSDQSSIKLDSLNNIKDDSMYLIDTPIKEKLKHQKENFDLDEIVVISDDDDLSPIENIINLSSQTISTASSSITDTEDMTTAKILTESSRIKIYNSIDEFDKNLPETVTLLRGPNGSKVYLVGTAHYSEQSQDDVSTTIRNVHPQIVMIELCEARIHILRYDEKTLLEEARDINLSKIRNIINTSGVINGIFYILLLNMSAKITKELGMAPGGEFRRAFEEASKIQNCTLHLGDRPINVTIQRALHGLSFWQSIKLLWRLVTSNETISKEEVERCKQKDLLEALMKEMAGEYPALGDVFVKERDMYLCNSLQMVGGYNRATAAMRPMNVVGVVGIGHTAGIKRLWGKVDPSKIPEITVIPPASRSNRIAKFTIKYGSLALISFGVYKIIRPRIGSIL